MTYLSRLRRGIVGPQSKEETDGTFELDLEEVRRSGLFDPEWYLNEYPDVAAAGLDPLWHYMVHGCFESRKPNSLFDSGWYLETYPDVRDAHLNPLLHYIRNGAIERRDAGPDYRPSVFQDPATPRGAYHLAAAVAYRRGLARLDDGADLPILAPARILIIAELSIRQCRKYRVDQKVELLTLLGHASTVLNWHDAEQCEAALSTHAIVFFYRVPAVDSVLRCIAKAKALGLPTFWEVDDLIFDPNAYMANSSVKTLSTQIQRSVFSGVPLYRAAMLACDATIASTCALAGAMRDAGAEQTYVVENALDVETLMAAAPATLARRTRNIVRIVYGSGTTTHDEDFKEAAAGIRACLETYPHVRLCIIGELNLPADFSAFGERVERLAGTTYPKYLQLLSTCDIAIAPLEPTLFNDAKSNIKYIEASMAGLPSVCSPRAEFAGVIDHGRNGLLAEGGSWFTGLQALILDPDLRRSMAKSAKATVLARYSAANIARTQLAPIIARLERPRRPLRVLAVNVFFEPRSFGGATIVAEQMARRLNDRPDTEVMVFTTAPPGTAAPYEVIRYDIDAMPVFAICVPDTRDPTLTFDTDHTLHGFSEVLRLTTPDVVHFHSIQGLGASLLKVCDEAGVPSVVTLHDAWWICGRQFMIKGDGRYCFQTRIDLNVCSACVDDSGLNLYRQYRLRDMISRADLLLTPSQFFHGIYAANDFPLQSLKVNRNGVERPLDFKRTSSDRLRFGFVGGNAEVKGARLIKQVFSSLERSDYDLVLIDNLLSLGFSSIMKNDWAVTGNLCLYPAYDQHNMDDFYSNIDVLLFPAQCKESFGLTVREALIRDIWVITTDAGGVVEDVVDGENGDIIPLLDDGTALKAAVLGALERVEALKAHRNAYKDRITDHRQQATQLREFLETTAREGKARRSVSAVPEAIASPAPSVSHPS